MLSIAFRKDDTKWLFYFLSTIPLSNLNTIYSQVKAKSKYEAQLDGKLQMTSNIIFHVIIP